MFDHLPEWPAMFESLNYERFDAGENCTYPFGLVQSTRLLWEICLPIIDDKRGAMSSPFSVALVNRAE